jgi:hypothetical protein
MVPEALGVISPSDYAQVERRSITFLDHTMSREEAFGLKKYIRIIHFKKKFGLSTEV